MTLVLLWRVPSRQIDLRWRGPAGLVAEVERDPLAPVAAVVGPPGPAGPALGAVFPPLAIAANAPSPAPAGGVGSAAWSTLLAKPVIWDGSVWRTFDYFNDPTLSDWWDEGALADLDMANGRYYLAEVGECSVHDVLVQDVVNWGPFNPLTDIVPDKGLFAMTAAAQGDARAVYPTLAPGVVAAIREAGGATVISHIRMDYTGTLEGTDTAGFGLEFFDLSPITFAANIGPQVSPVLGNDITVLHYPEASPFFTRNPQSGFGEKLGVTFDIASNTWFVSNGGSTVPGWTASPPIDFATLEVVGISMGPNKSSNGDAVLFPSWPRLTIFPPVADQAALNALTLGSSGVPIPPHDPSGNSLDFTTGALPAGVTFARASAGTWYDNAGVMQMAGANVPRYDNTPAGHVPRGLLIEPARTNLIPHGAALTNYTIENLILANDDAVAPDGTTTADKLTDTATNGNHRAYYIAGGSLGRVTFSLHAKPGTATWLWLLGYNSGFNAANFHLSGNGSLGTVDATAQAHTAQAGGGFYRCAVTPDAPMGGLHTQVALSDSADFATPSQVPSYSGSGQHPHLWGIQLEEGPQATSYIPTIGATATRAEDRLTVTGPAGKSNAHCTFEGGSVDIPVTPGPVTLTAADFGGPVHLHGIVFS